MSFDEINLVFGEKISLLSFVLKKKKTPKEIKYFQSLYYEYKFLQSNCIGQDEFGSDVFDGTYSIALRYRRYKVYLRKKRFEHLPNWLAVLIALMSFIVSVATLLRQLGLILQ